MPSHTEMEREKRMPVLERRGSLSIEPRGDKFIILNRGKKRSIRTFKSVGAARSYLRGLPSNAIVHASELSRGVPKRERFPVPKRIKNLVTQHKLDRG